MTKPILEVKELKKYFPVHGSKLFEKNRYLKAVDGISFDVQKGKTIGLIGESGCGKSTVGKAIMGLNKASGGSIKFKDEEVTSFNKNKMKEFRRNVQMIFQDPYSSLDPKKRINYIVKEPLQIHGIGTPKERMEKAKELLETVGLSYYFMNRYPHEFSGGQRQRINIARALMLDPQVLICDEPTSALDVSVQAQVLNLFKKLQEKFELTYLFISHDLSVVKYLSDEIAIMYLGKIVEMGESNEIYKNPLHPYTKALFSAIPTEDPTVKVDRIALKGEIPSPLNPPKGCHFHNRCPYAKKECMEVSPNLDGVANNHKVACYLYK
ncbi:ABC transporter ATP-binding protein [Maledivibacter halophilus]|uniref:Oligopeptide transport system ATP-binding protein n=1 Tax=Maledivibacter halophilus TaxID=36842 RepID=A0A1T5KQI2_9FIRM|nr:dipeptide ABC transporter ATP-binding protein [Maledivibacter halophilus]SKC65709.1 oligopeptide transport system ATP-binding protein [Maledivibacter halophilus]